MIYNGILVAICGDFKLDIISAVRLTTGEFPCDMIAMRAERMPCLEGCLEGSQGTFNVFCTYIGNKILIFLVGLSLLV